MARVDAHDNTAADYEESPEITDEEFARATVNKGGVPVRGRPPLGDRVKTQVTLRLDPDIVEHFRATGAGWQTSINDVLADFIAGGAPAPKPPRQPGRTKAA